METIEASIKTTNESVTSLVELTERVSSMYTRINSSHTRQEEIKNLKKAWEELHELIDTHPDLKERSAYDVCTRSLQLQKETLLQEADLSKKEKSILTQLPVDYPID